MRKQYTAAEREQFFEAIRRGASVREAATQVGVTPSTAYLWSKSRPSQDGPRFALFVHHDDAEREWAYDRESHIGKLSRGLDEATKRGWTVVGMKEDWKTVFPHR